MTVVVADQAESHYGCCVRINIKPLLLLLCTTGVSIMPSTGSPKAERKDLTETFSMAPGC